MKTASQNHEASAIPITSGGGALERLLTVAELSEYLGVPVATLYDWRVDGKGPRAFRIGRHLRFAVGDVHAWLATVREPEPGGAAPSRR